MESSRYVVGNEIRVDTVETIAASIAIALQQKQDVISVRSIPVRFDIYQGNAEIVAQQTSGGVHIDINFDSAKELVEKAISLYVKYDLLRELANLRDHGIQQVIEKHLGKLNGTEQDWNRVNVATVDTVLTQIKKGYYPTSGFTMFAAKAPLTAVQKDLMQSLGSVDEIQGIKQTSIILANLRPQMPGRSLDGP